MKKSAKDNSAKILQMLEQLYPDAHCALDHESPFQLLSSTILSAQCTDERVNKVTPELFKHYPTARKMAKAPIEHLEELVRTTGFFRSKAKSLHEMSNSLVNEFGGEVPDSMEKLIKLRGVGRKTANVVLGNSFNKNEGVVVDTHVGRLSRRFKFTKHNDPVKVEKDLMKLLPKEKWTSISHEMIMHGRALCKSQNPKCEICPISPICPSSLV